MRAGETDKAEVVILPEYTKIAKEISSKLGHIGNLDVDFIKTDSGQIFFIDFNPRFGGGYPFSHSAGCNYLKAIVDMKIGKELTLPDKPKVIVGMKGININFYEK